MSRRIIGAMVLLSLLAAATEASAQSFKHIRWCFHWRTELSDAGYGEDYLDDTTPYEPARYTAVTIRRFVPYSSTLHSWYLDSDGCTQYMEVSPSTTYHLTQFTHLRRGDRDVYVMQHGEDWESEEVYSYITSYTFSSYLPDDYYDVNISAPSYNGDSGMMVVIGQIMSVANTLDYPDGTDVWVSSDPDLGCGSITSVNVSDAHGHVCIDDSKLDDKFQIGHEFGHVISKMNNGPENGSYTGSEYPFRASGVGNRCDCDLAGGTGHCPTSREFTGSGQKEGFSHFAAAVAFNARSTSTSTYVFYKDIMKWGGTHGGVLPPTTLGWPPVYTFDAPFPADLSTSSNVKWIYYECDPTSGVVHYGNEWDWLSFFWNLYTDGGTSNRFDVSQINAIWDGVADSDIAEECCNIPEMGDGYYPNPHICLNHKPSTAACGSGVYGGLPVIHAVGKLWEADATHYDVAEGVRNQAYSTYNATNPDKYAHFRDTGIAAKIDY
jgi:hypothetical protein